MKGYSTLHMAAILSISSEQPKVKEVSKHLASLGSTGMAIIRWEFIVIKYKKRIHVSSSGWYLYCTAGKMLGLMVESATSIIIIKGIHNVQQHDRGILTCSFMYTYDIYGHLYCHIYYSYTNAYLTFSPPSRWVYNYHQEHLNYTAIPVNRS